MFGILRLELDRHFCKLFIYGFLIFAIFALLVIQVGIFKYNSDIKEQRDFVESEGQVIGRFINYHMYGTYGFRRVIEPSPTSSLFYNSTTLDDLHMFLDAGVRLRLNKNEIGKGLFERPTGGSLDFSWFIVVIGGFAYAIWGFFTFRNKEYLSFLLSFGSQKSVHWGIILARIILIIFSLAVVFCLAFVLFLINGLQLTPGVISGLLVHFLITVLVMVTLMCISAGFGAMKNWIKGVIFAGSFFVFLVFLLPEALNTVFSKLSEANMKSAYKHEAQKMEKLMLFEKVAYEYTSRFSDVAKRREADKEMLLNWGDKYYPEIEKMESQMFDVTQDLARKFQLWSSISPVTFYKSTNNEISSKGFNAYLSFYKEGQVNQKDFFLYYSAKKSYDPYEKVVPFLPTEKLVTKSKPGLPHYFLVGLFVSLIYIVVALILSFSRFKRFLFPKIQGNTAKIDINLEEGEAILLMTDDESNELLSDILNGYVDGFEGKIIVNGKSIVNKKRKDYHYFPNLKQIPGNLKISGKRLKGFKLVERAMIMLKISKKSIYFINLSDSKMYYDNKKEFIDALKAIKSEGAVLICFSTTESLLPLDFDYKALLINVDGDFKYDQF